MQGALKNKTDTTESRQFPKKPIIITEQILEKKNVQYTEFISTSTSKKKGKQEEIGEGNDSTHLIYFFNF